MLDIIKILFLISIYLVCVKCLIPSLSVQKLDRKVIEKKRQDTLDMCRIFNLENDKLQRLVPESADSPNYRSRRSKRDVGVMKIGNPVLDEQSAKRIENIVDKLYEDLDERVTYRQRNLESSTIPTDKFNKSIRRFNFAPAELIHVTTIGPNAPITDDNNTPGIPWHKKWPHGIIPYFIDPKTYDSLLADTIMKAFDYFERATCIRLQKLRDKPADEASMTSVEWLYITNPSGIRQCVHSNEKKVNKGVQKIVFGYDCLSLGQIVHEIMHVLGFSHEHTRPDRDQYITILWNNIKPGYKKYFEKRTQDPLLNIPYDYLSILHYPPRAFSKNGQITVMGQVSNDIRLGQREGLSETDVEKITYVFGHECIERNRQYLLKTCPSAVKVNVQWKNITQDEITDYFKERLWPYGIVNYKLKDKMEFTAEERENIRSVINHIEKETCIRFKDVSEEENNESDDTNDNNNPNNLPGSDTNVDGGNLPGSDAGIVTGTGSGNEAADVGAISGGGSNTDGNVNDIEGNEGTANKKLQASDKEAPSDGGVASDGQNKSLLQLNNEIVKSDGDNANQSPATADNDNIALRKGVTKKQRKARLSKIIKPDHFITQHDSKLYRRHAADVLVFVRSPEPGCTCPPPGRPSGNAVLKINADCFNSVNDLLHLFVHLLGLDHQHNMHDRDDYLHIMWDKLTPDIKDELRNKLPPAASVGFGYDYQSVMHYPWLQIKNGVTSIMYPIWNDGWAMGHWQGLSSTDVQKLNNLYFEQCVERKKQDSLK